MWDEGPESTGGNRVRAVRAGFDAGKKIGQK